MGLMFEATLDVAADAGPFDCWNLLAPSDAVVIIHEIRLTQSSEEGDAQAEMAELQCSRVTGAPTDGTGGVTTGVNPTEFHFPAAGSVVRSGDITTQLTGGTRADLIREGFNLQVGFFWQAPPKTVITLSPSQRFVVTLIPTLADVADFHGILTFEELGG